MNNAKKKSRFQERLDAAIDKYYSQEDRGSVNDKLNLHTMNDQGTGSTQTQSAQDPIDIKVFSIRDLEALTLLMEESIIPEYEMPQDPDARDGHYGFNTGIKKCADILNRTIRETKLKLHKEDLK